MLQHRNLLNPVATTKNVEITINNQRNMHDNKRVHTSIHIAISSPTTRSSWLRWDKLAIPKTVHFFPSYPTLLVPQIKENTEGLTEEKLWYLKKKHLVTKISKVS